MNTGTVESRLAALEEEVATLHKLLEQTRMAARVRRGLDQADRGEMVPARQAMQAIRQKYNIQPR